MAELTKRVHLLLFEEDLKDISMLWPHAERSRVVRMLVHGQLKHIKEKGLARRAKNVDVEVDVEDLTNGQK